jgi:adenylosuccinate lyase
MQLQPLKAISPIDGRYYSQLHHLNEYFSEFALIRYRVKVEIEYFLFLAEKKFFKLTPHLKKQLIKVFEEFSLEDAQKIKDIEYITNHDVKAVEYFLKEKLTNYAGDDLREWIHFGLTSQDINNTAFPLLWKDAMQHEYLPAVQNLQHELYNLATEWKNIPMLARTHGQPATPTMLGKEIMVFVERIEDQVQQFSSIPFTGKFGGATGNFNAHCAAYPKTNWPSFADKFMESKLGLRRQQYTTQIEHYDLLAAHFDNIKRINNILIDFCRDIWTYISIEYFKQKINKDEIGSSAMPHKINPIDFENAEGNLGLANALLEHLSAKLPVSRLQRDLTDSTVIRNVGMPVAYTVLAFLSIGKGLNKLILNKQKIDEDLENNWSVIAEAIQTILRRENFPLPFEALKQLTRGNNVINKKVVHKFIDGLQISPGLKKELKEITPHSYTGQYPLK